MYCFPYANVADVSSVTVTVTPSDAVLTSPFTSTVISLAVKPIALRYLSVPFIGILAVWSAGLATAVPATSQIGSTTSTIVPVPLPPGMLTPDVIVVFIFPFALVPFPLGPLSVAVPAFTATVITPL